MTTIAAAADQDDTPVGEVEVHSAQTADEVQILTWILQTFPELDEEFDLE